jgi:hypothetical protein
MKIKRQSSSSGLFTGQPGIRSRSGSIAYSYPSIHYYPRHESSTSLDEVFETNESFTFKEVKRKPLDLDPLEFEELLNKRRESQRTINFLHRQDSKPLLINVERERRVPLSNEKAPFPTLHASGELPAGALEWCQSEEESGINKYESKGKSRYRRIFRFHPFKGRSGLRGLTSGVSKIFLSEQAEM